MKLEAKQRLIASMEIVAADVKTFLKSIGLDPKDMGTPKLAKDGKTWVMDLNQGRGLPDIDEVKQEVTRALGKPFSLTDFGYSVCLMWAVKGKGVVILDLNNEELRIVSSTTREIPKLIIDIVGGLSDDFAAKSSGIDGREKTITYQCYERSGQAAAKSVLLKLMKYFGLSDWKLSMEKAHWG